MDVIRAELLKTYILETPNGVSSLILHFILCDSTFYISLCLRSMLKFDNFLSRFKGWMNRFHGVSTKHLLAYMYWFKLLEIFKEDRDEIKYHKLFVQSHATYSTTKIKDFK